MIDPTKQDILQEILYTPGAIYNSENHTIIIPNSSDLMEVLYDVEEEYYVFPESNA